MEEEEGKGERGKKGRRRGGRQEVEKEGAGGREGPAGKERREGLAV
jgi:hypothetical protein